MSHVFIVLAAYFRKPPDPRVLVGAYRLSSKCSILAVLITVAALLVPSLTRGDEPAQKIARVGFLGTESFSRGVPPFWERLHELGWIEGNNLVIVARSAEGRVERLPGLMNQILVQNVDVVFTYHTPGAVAAKRATSTIPIVAAMIGDPVGTGLAASLARPGGNLTAISLAYTEEFGGKWLELLHEIVPRLSAVAVIGNPASQWVASMRRELQDDATRRQLGLRFIEVRDVDEIERAFVQAQRQAQGAIMLADPLTLHNWQQVLSFAAKYRVPTLYPNPEFAEHGGLLAYGVDSAGVFRRAAEYVNKILRGAKPADLPIEQATQYTLVINLKTARTLGLTVPEPVLLLADKVIR
jgi:putative ABC transport system substrate-binding protein